MKIGIDIRTLENNQQHRGLGRYITSLIEHISEIDHENNYLLITSTKGAVIPKFNFHKNFKYKIAHDNPPLYRHKPKIKLLFVAPKKLNPDDFNIDVIFHPDYYYPIKFGRVPAVGVIYDLIPFLFKEQYQAFSRTNRSLHQYIAQYRHIAHWYFLRRQIKLFKKYKKIISISDSSKNDLVKFNRGIKQSQVETVYLASGEFEINDQKINPKITQIAKQKYILYTGGGDYRKGVSEFIQSIAKIKDKLTKDYHTKIVLVGKDFEFKDHINIKQIFKSIEDNHLQDIIEITGFINDAELDLLYKNALVYVFPSRYEGFGLPLLEAMHRGVPTICYNNSSIPEVVGDAALLIDDGQDMSSAIIDLLQSEKLRKELIVKGYQQYQKFNWHDTATKTLQLIVEAGQK